MDKLHQQLLSPEVARPFSTWQDVALRLIPYHVYSEPELPQGAMEKGELFIGTVYASMGMLAGFSGIVVIDLVAPVAEAVYEGIAGVLQSKAQGMMSRFEQILDQESKVCNVCTTCD